MPACPSLQIVAKSLGKKYLQKISRSLSGNILEIIKKYAIKFFKEGKKIYKKLPKHVRENIEKGAVSSVEKVKNSIGEKVKEKAEISLKESIILGVEESLSSTDGLYNYIDNILLDFQKNRRKAILSLF